MIVEELETLEVPDYYKAADIVKLCAISWIKNMDDFTQFIEASIAHDVLLRNNTKALTQSGFQINIAFNKTRSGKHLDYDHREKCIMRMRYILKKCFDFSGFDTCISMLFVSSVGDVPHFMSVTSTGSVIEITAVKALMFSPHARVYEEIANESEKTFKSIRTDVIAAVDVQLPTSSRWKEIESLMDIVNDQYKILSEKRAEIDRQASALSILERNLDSMTKNIHSSIIADAKGKADELFPDRFEVLNQRKDSIDRFFEKGNTSKSKN